MNKIPCATCPDICELAIGLYNSFHFTKEFLKDNGGEITKMELYCHKADLTYEIEGKEMPR